MTIGALSVGMKVRIKKAFRDFDGKLHEPGAPMTLVSRSYFIYDGGYTLGFSPGGTMRLAEISAENCKQLEDAADEWWEIVK